MNYLERSFEAKNPTAKKLLALMHNKQTNLCVSLDVTSASELLAIADAVGPEICLLKTHIDIVEDFSDDMIASLLKLAQEHSFMIFEDRKFADIGNTVKLQYGSGMYHIAEWADIVNAHVLPGPGVIQGLKEVGLSRGRGLLLVAELSSVGSLAIGEYTKTAYAMAKEHADFVIGFIGKGSTDIPEGMLVMTPGVNLDSAGDGLGQQYQTPQQAVAAGSDIIIVGRGIYAASNPAAAAREYRDAAWSAVA